MNKRVIASLRNVFDGIMIFMLFIGTTVYALPSNGVTYDNSTSGSSATNVGDAIDDLYSKLSIKDNEINRLKGIGNASSNNILSGYTALVQGSTVTGSIPSKGATTYTPGTQDQTIASNQYLSGNQTIKGDANLVSGNIAAGKSIFGVNGTYTSDANAVAANILSGKTAYVNGSKINGSMDNYSGRHVWVNTDNGSFHTNIDYAYGSGTVTHQMVGFTSKYSGYFDSSTKFIFGEESSIASNIRSGTNFLGVNGTYTSDANAASGNILSGKTAYVNGSKITGTMANNGALNKTITVGGAVSLPAGYTSGGTVKTTHTIKSWTPNYGGWVNAGGVHTNDTYNIKGTNLYVLARAENGGSVSQYAAPSCSNGTVTLLINTGAGVLYQVQKTNDATFTLDVNLTRNYSQYPNSTLKIYAFTVD